MKAHRRTVSGDSLGLSTIEYVLILIVVVCVGIAGWKMFGHSTTTRASQASGEVTGLGVETGGRGGGGPVANAGSTGGHSRLDEATGDATPPDEGGGFGLSPPMLLGAAAVLVVAIVGARIRRNAKGGGGQVKAG